VTAATAPCYLARQPILGRRRTVVGFDLQFRPPGSGRELVHDVRASASVMLQAFADLGVAEVLGNRFGIVHIGPDLFWSEAVELLPHQQVMLELTDDVELDAAARARCAQLREAGYGLAVALGRYTGRLPEIDLIRVDAFDPDVVTAVAAARAASPGPCRVLADRISSHAQADEAAVADADLLQGWFFAEPVTVMSRTVDASHLSAMTLLTQLLTEREVSDIERTIKQDPSLTHRLLRIANASANGLRHPVGSVRQAISLIGRVQLLRWAQLLVYAGGFSDPLGDPLLLTAATRGRLLEELVRQRQQARGRAGDPEQAGRAFLVGVLSLLDVLLGVPMSEVIADLPLDPRIIAALLLRSGELGELLRLVELYERDDVEGMNLLHASLGDPPIGDLWVRHLEASCWADELTRAMAV
jgi:c-di-GMP-related signal transduction protein